MERCQPALCWLAMAGASQTKFEQLSRRHGIKLAPVVNCSVEDCSLAVGKAVGFDSIMSASRMNSAVVIFLDTIEKVNSVVQSGVVIQDTFTPVIPLVQPAKRIILANVPPFIKDETLINELSRHGKIVSQMKRIPLGCKSPLLKHVVCFRRQLYMILKCDLDELNLSFKFKVDGFDYVVFATSDTMRCFSCGQEGHVRRACPERVNDSEPGPSRETVHDSGSAMLTESSAVGDDGSNAAGQSLNSGEKGPDAVSADVVGRNIESGEEENDVAADVVDVAESIVEEEEMVTDIVSDETLFKIPNIKRKRARKSSEMAKMSRSTTAGSVKLDDSEGSMIDDSDSEVVDSKTGRSRRSDYNFDKIKSFLQKTKNAKNVQFEEFFADRRMFINSVIVLMKGEGGEQFTVQEIYRLKKLVSKLKLELQNEDGFETT